MKDIRKDPAIYLNDMMDAIANIKDFVGKKSREEFEKDKMAFAATVRELEVIGEAARRVPSEFREKHKEIEWRKIIGMKNKLIHGYDKVDLDVVWNVVKDELPKLEEKLKAMER